MFQPATNKMFGHFDRRHRRSGLGGTSSAVPSSACLILRSKHRFAFLVILSLLLSLNGILRPVSAGAPSPTQKPTDAPCSSAGSGCSHFKDGASLYVCGVDFCANRCCTTDDTDGGIATCSTDADCCGDQQCDIAGGGKCLRGTSDVLQTSCSIPSPRINLARNCPSSNRAPACPALQSSNLFSPDGGNDGDVGTISHTYNGVLEWWRVEFADESSVQEIIITNRQGYQDRIEHAVVELVDADGEPLPVAGVTLGRFDIQRAVFPPTLAYGVRIRNDPSMASLYLNLAEVEIYSNVASETTDVATDAPTNVPSSAPSEIPSQSPSEKPTSAPSNKPSGDDCMRASTELQATALDGASSTLKPVSSLSFDETIPGLIGDSEIGLERSQCRPIFIAKVEKDMAFFGNYTSNHLVLRANETGNDVVPHGEQSFDATTEGVGYDVMTDCPVAEDASGVLFAPISSGSWCVPSGSAFPSFSWKDYLTIYRTLRKLSILFQVKDFSFLTSIDDAHANLDGICGAIIDCSNTGTKAGCASLESTLASFVANATTPEFQENVANITARALGFFDEVTTSLANNPSDDISLGSDAARYIITVLRDDVGAFHR